MKPDSAREFDRLVERGCELLREQAAGDAPLSERAMRLDLAREFCLDERDLHCAMAAAGARYHAQYVAPRRLKGAA